MKEIFLTDGIIKGLPASGGTGCHACPTVSAEAMANAD